MGLSATQARYLQLTARKSDNEYQAQQINQMRSNLADKMQDISMKYSNGINNRQLNFVVPSGDGSNVSSVRLTYDTITAEYPNGLGYTLIDKYGTEVRPNEKSAVALREQAKADLAAARAEGTFRVSVPGSDNNTVAVDVTGDNYMTLIGNSAVVQNKNGQLVDSETFQKNIKGMSAEGFSQYWNMMGFSFVGTEQSQIMTQHQNADKLAAAEKAYEAAMAQADEIENKSCIYDDRCNDPEYLENQLRTGQWTLQRLSTTAVDEKGEFIMEEVYYGSVGNITDTLYTEDDASITAEYDTKMDYFEHKDKELELQLQQLQTSHNAIQTEIDSVKKVIEKNVEKSFKTFG